MAYTTLGVIILWFGWFGFNAGSTMGIASGDKLGYFAYVALTTNVAAAAGGLGGVLVSWLVIKKPDLSMMLNGVVAALVAVTAACGFVAPWAAIVIGFVAGAIAVGGRALRRADRDRRPDRRRRRPRHGRGLGHARDRDLRGAGARREPRHRHGRALVHGLASTSSARRRSASSPSAPSPSPRRSRRLWLMKATFGIRVEHEVETAGLDVSEHGMWGYPEFYIPVPGRLRDREPRPPGPGTRAAAGVRACRLECHGARAIGRIRAGRQEREGAARRPPSFPTDGVRCRSPRAARVPRRPAAPAARSARTPSPAPATVRAAPPRARSPCA